MLLLKFQVICEYYEFQKSYPHFGMIQNVDMIFGTHNIHKLPEILEEAYLSKAMVVEVWLCTEFITAIHNVNPCFCTAFTYFRKIFNDVAFFR
jgi:tRNA A37 methylthiotransferase MiaB